MSNKRAITKTVVNNVVNFGISATTSNIVRHSLPKTGNAVIDTAMYITAFTTSWAVSSTIDHPVKAETNRQIDTMFDAFEELKSIKNAPKQ